MEKRKPSRIRYRAASTEATTAEQAGCGFSPFRRRLPGGPGKVRMMSEEYARTVGPAEAARLFESAVAKAKCDQFVRELIPGKLGYFAKARIIEAVCRNYPGIQPSEVDRMTAEQLLPFLDRIVAEIRRPASRVSVVPMAPAEGSQQGLSSQERSGVIPRVLVTGRKPKEK